MEMLNLACCEVEELGAEVPASAGRGRRTSLKETNPSQYVRQLKRCLLR